MPKAKKDSANPAAEKKSSKEATKELTQRIEDTLDQIPAGEQEVQMDRRWKSRRSEDGASAETAAEGAADAEAEAAEKPQPRRKKQRRRQIDPTTCERDYNDEEVRFMRAMDDYKRDSGRMFPTCSEILEVVRSLGYIKLTEEEQALIDSIQQVEDELAESVSENEGGEAEAAFPGAENDELNDENLA